MKTVGLISVVLVVSLGVVALASQSNTDETPDIKTLADADAAIHALTLRVAALEARLDGTSPDAASGHAAPAPSPAAGALKVESIETVQPTDDAKAEAKAIQVEADQLEQQADSMDTNISNVSVNSGSGISDSARSAARRQINTYKTQMSEARRSAKEKRKQADALLAPRQVIRGWSGKKSVEAISDRDLSAQLKGIVVGSYVTADWTMVDMDDDSAKVTIRSIKSVAKPAGFVERPASAKN